ncbi:CRISPR-associated protein Cas4 [Flexistipes sinusarabici DSM 4947]|uniref:CRISPR-associated exonuclease Cas4 n=1 Tax=Flexistipes sinusarabici (strain ATCC 49648 / DSM 4947 / MAS 10) TaxID=717231 RepID=F8E5B5_FLESM|nr:CRISPR-associated protein Cas4 [Flexistipes sinusarabici]AEI14611.1 CRISPR-associated protein Cas4 [Flexistipes sinusarabici DSM 4947]
MLNPIVTGTQINYYFVCKRKLWLFSHNISMEQYSESVEIGKIVHETSYERKRKEIELDGIKIDFFDKNKGIIHEVKKSKAIEDAHIWQLKYYIYYFRQLGINVTGKINYPLIRKTENIDLNDEDIYHIVNICDKINEITSRETPPDVINEKICKKCSYFELCYV